MYHLISTCFLILWISVLSWLVTPALAVEPKAHMLTVAPNFSHFTHKDNTMKETGMLYGALAAYSYHGELLNEKISTAMFKLEGRIVVGRMNFDGKLFDGQTYSIDKVKNFIGEVRALGGYDFSLFSQTTLTPYSGLAYRFYKDNLSKVDAGYRRESHYWYIPIGLETNTPITTGWSAGMNLEYDFLLSGTQNTFLSDLDAVYSDMTNDLNKGYGMRGSIKVHKEMANNNIILEPYVIYWSIDQSKETFVKASGAITQSSVEPKNTSTEIGMKVAVEF